MSNNSNNNNSDYQYYDYFQEQYVWSLTSSTTVYTGTCTNSTNNNNTNTNNIDITTTNPATATIISSSSTSTSSLCDFNTTMAVSANDHDTLQIQGSELKQEQSIQQQKEQQQEQNQYHYYIRWATQYDTCCIDFVTNENRNNYLNNTSQQRHHQRRQRRKQQPQPKLHSCPIYPLLPPSSTTTRTDDGNTKNDTKKSRHKKNEKLNWNIVGYTTCQTNTNNNSHSSNTYLYEAMTVIDTSKILIQQQQHHPSQSQIQSQPSKSSMDTNTNNSSTSSISATITTQQQQQNHHHHRRNSSLSSIPEMENNNDNNNVMAHTTSSSLSQSSIVDVQHDTSQSLYNYANMNDNHTTATTTTTNSTTVAPSSIASNKTNTNTNTNNNNNTTTTYINTTPTQIPIITIIQPSKKMSSSSSAAASGSSTSIAQLIVRRCCNYYTNDNCYVDSSTGTTCTIDLEYRPLSITMNEIVSTTMVNNQRILIWLGSADSNQLYCYYYYCYNNNDNNIENAIDAIPSNLIPVPLPLDIEAYIVSSPVMKIQYIQWEDDDDKSSVITNQPQEQRKHALVLACQDGTVRLITFDLQLDEKNNDTSNESITGNTIVSFHNVRYNQIIIDGPIATLHVQIFNEGELPNRTDHIMNRTIHVIIGSLCGYVAELYMDIRTMEFVPQPGGPTMIVQGLWNTRFHIEDSVLTVHQYKTYTCIGTQSGRCYVYERRRATIIEDDADKMMMTTSQQDRHYVLIWYCQLSYPIHSICMISDVYVIVMTRKMVHLFHKKQRLYKPVTNNIHDKEYTNDMGNDSTSEVTRTLNNVFNENEAISSGSVVPDSGKSITMIIDDSNLFQSTATTSTIPSTTTLLVESTTAHVVEDRDFHAQSHDTNIIDGETIEENQEEVEMEKDHDTMTTHTTGKLTPSIHEPDIATSDESLYVSSSTSKTLNDDIVETQTTTTTIDHHVTNDTASVIVSELINLI